MEKNGCGFEAEYCQQDFPDEIQSWFARHAKCLGVQTSKDGKDLPCIGSRKHRPRALKFISQKENDNLHDLFGTAALAANPLLREITNLRSEVENLRVTSVAFFYDMMGTLVPNALQKKSLLEAFS